MPLFRRESAHSEDDGTLRTDNGGGTENGDAYWTWDPIEYVPVPTARSFTELIPVEQTPVDAVRAALDSFGAPDSRELREAALAAWRDVMTDSP